ncbi:unnamed protein product [Eruca vesicaria subsp. sativa]|uniref:ERAD-associated E3 ubiquitin-protein ligase component HRD3A n=1 Tax=Eruca vesicaria subsp. sativa TaxID=29727 RepID=A0ABC8JT20_ERUVS|nr:unnamed protein product [Eruca vesicaria subsp. sativa]
MSISSSHKIIAFSQLIFSLYIYRVHAQHFILNFSDEDFHNGFDNNSTNEDSYSENFGQTEPISDQDLDPGSWRPILELDHALTLYYSALKKMVSASSEGNFKLMEEAVMELNTSASFGDPHAQSVMGLVYEMGITREVNGDMSFLQHQLASEGGNIQSKMALAFRYIQLNMYDKAVQLYAEVAEAALNSFLISTDFSMVAPFRIHRGAEEDKYVLRRFRGEDDEDFKMLEYHAQIGKPSAMYKTGLFYYFSLRGLRHDHAKAVYWFTKAVEKGDLRSMEILGEIYARGIGVERNYSKAFECLTLAAQGGLDSAFTGLGYLYLKGYGVDKNYTMARECFENVSDNENPSGMYYLGMLYLKGIGVKRDVKQATKYFLVASNAGLPKAMYQMAKMLHAAAELKKNPNMLKLAAALYKSVAERGPWSSLSRWALEAYVKGDVGKAFLLYSRMSELGYEVAQSNAAWILDKYGERSMCMGVSGFCTVKERKERAHALWWRASKQGNDYAALHVGDAYYYGRGKEKDFVLAAEAYMYAKSQLNAQAMFNLGYMHEYGQGLPFDLSLAKSYYNQALENEPVSKLPIMLALARLWVRKNYVDVSIMVTLLLASLIPFCISGRSDPNAERSPRVLSVLTLHSLLLSLLLSPN